MINLPLQASCLKVMSEFRIRNDTEFSEYKRKLCMVGRKKDLKPGGKYDFEFALENGFAIDRKGNGYVNLAHFINNPFTEKSSFNFELMATVIQLGFRLLDNLHLNLKSIPTISMDGVADTLTMLGFTYGSINGRKQIERIMRSFRDEVIDCSIRLAGERGSYSGMDKNAYLNSEWGLSLPSDFKIDIARFGLRQHTHIRVHNSNLVALSFFNGVSPNFCPAQKFQYGWPVKEEFGLMGIVTITNHACRVYQLSRSSIGLAPKIFSDVSDTKLHEIQRMQRSIAKFIDGAVEPIADRVLRYCDKSSAIKRRAKSKKLANQNH